MLKTAAVAALVVLAGLPGYATTTLPVHLADLARSARVIARGRVVSVDTRWTDDRREIETLVTLDPESYLKGGPAPFVRFRVPGGQLGRYRRVVVGAPQFTEGQRVIVFLGAQSPAIPYVIGLNQGVFRLVADRNGAIRVSAPPTAGPAGRAARIVRGDRARRPMPLDLFEREVRALAGAAP